MNTSKNPDRALARRIKQHVNAKEHLFFAIVQPGFEETAKNELKKTGVKKIVNTIEGGIEFHSSLDDCYRVNICSRTISRVLMRLTKFRAERFNKLKAKVIEFPWELFLSDGIKISFSTTTSHSPLYHTKKIEDEVKQAISARLNEYGIKASYHDKGQNDESQKIFIRIEKSTCHLSLDTSGHLLHKRGQKKYITDAPIRETTAALILHEAGISNYDILVDPMCGSGTFSIEAAGIVENTCPGIDNEFIFMKWPSFRQPAYDHLLKKLHTNNINTDKKIGIYSSDIDEEAIDISTNNIQSAGFSKLINIQQNDFFNYIIDIPENKKCLIVINPPYGKRLKGINIEKLFREIGKTIRKNYSQCGYAIISPDLKYEKIMSLQYDRKILFMNGGIKVAVIIKDSKLPDFPIKL